MIKSKILKNLYKWYVVWLLNRVEIIMANGEIAHDEQFLLLTPWFQKSSAAETSESVYKWERVKKNRRNDSILLFWNAFKTSFASEMSKFSSIRQKGFISVCYLLLIIVNLTFSLINPFLHIDAFWRLCSRQLLKRLAKGEIAHNEQFLLLPQYFQFFFQ